MFDNDTFSRWAPSTQCALPVLAHQHIMATVRATTILTVGDDGDGDIAFPVLSENRRCALLGFDYQHSHRAGSDADLRYPHWGIGLEPGQPS